MAFESMANLGLGDIIVEFRNYTGKRKDRVEAARYLILARKMSYCQLHDLAIAEYETRVLFDDQSVNPGPLRTGSNWTLTFYEDEKLNQTHMVSYWEMAVKSGLSWSTKK